jgi:hypothetical protein
MAINSFIGVAEKTKGKRGIGTGMATKSVSLTVSLFRFVVG